MSRQAARPAPRVLWTRQAVDGRRWSGVAVPTTTRSSATPASARARRAASAARSEVTSSGAASRRSRIPVRSTIHSSEVSTMASRAELVRTRLGTTAPGPAMVANAWTGATGLRGLGRRSQVGPPFRRGPISGLGWQLTTNTQLVMVGIIKEDRSFTKEESYGVTRGRGGLYRSRRPVMGKPHGDRLPGIDGEPRAGGEGLLTEVELFRRAKAHRRARRAGIRALGRGQPHGLRAR